MSAKFDARTDWLGYVLPGADYSGKLVLAPARSYNPKDREKSDGIGPLNIEQPEIPSWLPLVIRDERRRKEHEERQRESAEILVSD